MARRRRTADELTVEELRHLLIEKRRSARQRRLDHFRRTGRIIQVESVPKPVPLGGLAAEPLLPEEEVVRQQRPAPVKTWLDRFLLLIEVAAVIGLGYVLVTGAGLLRSLNQEVAAALVLPTPSPTPLIQVVVLPSGHTPPRDGVSRFNEAEIPEHLRPLVQSMAEITLPTPGPQHAQNIRIPAINVNAPVVQGDGWEQLKKGVGQHPGTPNPGETGNIVLSAHNDVFGEIFRDLDKLQPGDEIILQTQQKTYTYIVRQTQIVEPTQVEVMAPTREPVVTLISCYPYLVDNQRIVVTAYLAEGN
ncbi:MAG: class D sortase [Chloroflexi bacterium]|nr:class D sortase [Chloroflexota bacterium]